MQQWREPLSRTISPKLIYTTAAKPQYGLKAFVVDDEWYVKKHGGTSQQYNYTGLVNPSQAQRMDGLPNNLSKEGLNLLTLLEKVGLPFTALNLYVAAIYNSEIAAEFLDEASSGSPFAVRIPVESQLVLARDLAIAGKRLRDLNWLLYLAEGHDHLEGSELVQFEESLFDSVALTKKTVRSRRFKAREVYMVPENLNQRIREQVDAIQEQVDRLAIEIYN